MDSHMPSPQLGTPLTPSGYSSVTSSTVYAGRMSTGLRRFGEKLKLWSHKPTNAEDVYHSMRQTFKTYEKFNSETQKLLETLREWSLTVPNPALQVLVRDTTLALKPMWDPSRNTEMRTNFDAILQGLLKLQHDEAVSQDMERQAQASKRAMHKAIYQRYDEEYIDQYQRQWEMLRVQAETEEMRFATTSTVVITQTTHRLLEFLSDAQHALRDGCNVGFKAVRTFSEHARRNEADLISPDPSDIGSDVHPLNEPMNEPTNEDQQQSQSQQHSKGFTPYNPHHRHPHHPQNPSSRTQSLTGAENFARNYEGFDVWKPQN